VAAGTKIRGEAHEADELGAANRGSRNRASEHSEPTRSDERLRPSRRLLANAPVLVGVFAMAVYFVWVCLQMAPRTQGGDGLLAVIFGAAIAGTIAAVAALWRHGREQAGEGRSARIAVGRDPRM
jgi:hypothetical protein